MSILGLFIPQRVISPEQVNAIQVRLDAAEEKLQEVVSLADKYRQGVQEKQAIVSQINLQLRERAFKGLRKFYPDGIPGIDE